MDGRQEARVLDAAVGQVGEAKQRASQVAEEADELQSKTSHQLPAQGLDCRARQQRVINSYARSENSQNGHGIRIH